MRSDLTDNAPSGSAGERMTGDVVHSAASYWQSIGAADVASFEPGTSVPQSARFVVVGGGFAGLATAIRLKEAEPEASVVVLEAQFVGYGASGRNGGLMSPLAAPVWLMTAGSNASHAWALRALNREVARLAAWASAIAPAAEVRRDRLRLEAKGLITASALHEISRTVSGAGIACQLASHEVDGNPALELDAHTVNPFQLAQSLARHAQRLGVIVCEGVGVTGIDPAEHGATVRLDTGRRLDARRVIVATNAYTTRKLIGEAVPARVVQNYMVATEPESHSPVRHSAPFVVELNKAYVFYRRHGARVVYGGIEKFTRSKGGPFDVPMKVYVRLQALLKASLSRPVAPRITHAWGGMFHMTPTDLPVIRRSHANPAVILNIGYGGTGVALTLACAGMAAACARDGHYRTAAEKRLHRIMSETQVPVLSAVTFACRVGMRALSTVLQHATRRLPGVVRSR